jgi:glycine/D-amino acid oxidase-like deaminating enzyme
VKDSASVVVIGAGVIGLSAARALAERGADDVLVVDRFVMGSGGTGRSSGVVRCHYGIRSLAAMAWRSLSVLAGGVDLRGEDTGYRRTGYLVAVGETNVDALQANLAMHQQLGIEVEQIDHQTAGQLWPQARFDDVAAFAYETLGGYGDGHRTALAFASAARRGGVRLRQHTPVATVFVRGDRIAGVELVDGDRIEADQVVVAAGPWSPSLVAGVGLDLPIRSQRAQILLVDTDTDTDGLGPVPVLSDLVSLQYIRPEGDASLLLGDSDHSEPEWSDPDRYSDQADDRLLVRSIAKFDHRFPGLPRARLQSSYAGCYDVTPDYNPIISATPVDGLWICAGFSGHGYKISPAVGDLVADLVLTGKSQVGDINHRDFRLERFDEDQLLVSAHPYVGAGQMR